jgi:hypothetical protein
MEDLLFSICSYESLGESTENMRKGRKAILLRIKHDKYYNDYMLMMRFL